ncbi:MAG: hypothetical protein ACI8VT_002245, partial [Saprospiraceae bacterium]
MTGLFFIGTRLSRKTISGKSIKILFCHEGTKAIKPNYLLVPRVLGAIIFQ